MLSTKFIVIVVIVIFLVIGFSIFPPFHTLYSELPTTYQTQGGVDTPLPAMVSALVKLAPYLLLFLIGYGAYRISKK